MRCASKSLTVYKLFRKCLRQLNVKTLKKKKILVQNIIIVEENSKSQCLYGNCIINVCTFHIKVVNKNLTKKTVRENKCAEKTSFVT